MTYANNVMVWAPVGGSFCIQYDMAQCDALSSSVHCLNTAGFFFRVAFCFLSTARAGADLLYSDNFFLSFKFCQMGTMVGYLRLVVAVLETLKEGLDQAPPTDHTIYP